MRFAASFVCITACLALGAPLDAQTPLPDAKTFLAETRKHLQTDWALQRDYVYVETRHDQRLDEDGRVTAETVRTIESYPALPGEDKRWERVITINGKPVPAAELARLDQERQKKAEETLARSRSDAAKERERQAAAMEKDRRETEEAIGDIFLVYDIKMIGRESMKGRETIKFDLTPKADPKPRTREGWLLSHMVVQAWIDEAEHELVRLEAEAIETASIGWGLIFRLHKGARMSIERRKVNNEVWLPASRAYSGSARVGLIKTIRRGVRSEFTSYRRFSVDAVERYTSTQQ